MGGGVHCGYHGVHGVLVHNVVLGEVMPFTKLDSGIVRSSIMAEPPEVFKVWIALLSCCDADGVARLSPTYLAATCFMTLETVKAALERLAGPDDESRSTNDGGRRIRRVDGGYMVINYAKYREWTYSHKQDAVRQRRYRERKRDNVPDISGHSASASSSDLDLVLGEESEERSGRKRFVPPTVEEVRAYCVERKNRVDAQKFCDHYETRNWIPKGANRQMASWQAAVRTWERSEYNNAGVDNVATEEVIRKQEAKENRVIDVLTKLDAGQYITHAEYSLLPEEEKDRCEADTDYYQAVHEWRYRRVQDAGE